MTLAIGVIGLGVMGAEHLRLLRNETRDAQVVAVCDADDARAQSLKGDATVFADPLALIGSDKVEAVVIASPDNTPASLAMACIASGKRVLCEKPLGGSTQDALKVIDAEISSGKRYVQTGYMRRFDPAYLALQTAVATDQIGNIVLMHNVHRNKAAPKWFRGAMAITNSFVHEIDVSRWLLGWGMASARIVSAKGGDPILITMETDLGQLVSTEVYLNAGYGYHVHCQLVGTKGTVETLQDASITSNRDGRSAHVFPDNWIPRFREAYRLQMNAWVKSVQDGTHVGASAWDGYVATAIAEQLVVALRSDTKVSLFPGPLPALYI
ncbi:MAG: hypothetical protein RLZZ528_1825 [Pseudomonadota bacterium]